VLQVGDDRVEHSGNLAVERKIQVDAVVPVVHDADVGLVAVEVDDALLD